MNHLFFQAFNPYGDQYCMASSLAPEQLSRGSDLLQGIIRNSKLLTPAGISVAWTHARADEQAPAGSKRCSSGMSPRTTSMGPDDVIYDIIC